MDREHQRDLGLVLRALHFASTRTATGPSEQRGENYGPAEWHEAVELWNRALTIETTADFDSAWSSLVAQAVKFLRIVKWKK
jgi:hypothetical protein